MSGETPLRAVRALLFTGICVVLALVGHVATSTSAVPWWAPVGAGVLIGAISWAAAGERRGLLVIGGGLLLAQGALHTLFTRTGKPPAAAPTAEQIEAAWLRLLMCGDLVNAGPSRTAAELLRGMRLDPTLALRPPGGDAPSIPGLTGTTGTGMAGMHHGGGGGGYAMLTAHVLVASLCAVWLWHGERAVFRLVALAAPYLLDVLRFLPAPVNPPEPPRPPALRVIPPTPPRVVCRPLSRRGPPVAVST